MSLDVTLHAKDEFQSPLGSGIFIREGGKTIEISEEDWYKQNPDREPVRLSQRPEVTTVLYHDNLTHNLTRMASAAGLYAPMWRPGEQGWTKASQLVEPLTAGYAKLTSDPDHFKQWNPENGWGNYEGLVESAGNLLLACLRYPDATVEADV